MARNDGLLHGSAHTKLGTVSDLSVERKVDSRESRLVQTSCFGGYFRCLEGQLHKWSHLALTARVVYVPRLVKSTEKMIQQKYGESGKGSRIAIKHIMRVGL